MGVVVRVAPRRAARALTREALRNAWRLAKARRAARDLFQEQEPLVSVVIPTYNRAQLLTERALASVLRQTYPRFEVIVVGDACTDDTADRVAAVGDARVQFVNLPTRTRYPDDPWHRWLVVGTGPANHALALARGRWFAYLDDDDEFSADHIEVLLRACLDHRLEFAYGVTEMEFAPGVWHRVGAFPPAPGRICHAAVVYASHLRVFRYDPECWRRNEPNDWNLWRRMWAAGVRMGFVDHVVARHYLEGRYREPLTPPVANGARRSLAALVPRGLRRVVRRALGQAQRSATGPDGRPEWEYVPEGWRARDPGLTGWNVPSVVAAQYGKWPRFVALVQGAGPLGIYHEAATLSNTSAVAHHSVMTYGYVLGLAAGRRARVSILDWGGGLGHYYVFGRALRPDLALDYYVADVPLLCQAGQAVLSEVRFSADPAEYLARPYDLVMASGALHYAEDWKAMVAALARVSRPYLYVTRLPLVQRAPSFVVVQRPAAHGYATEYLGWFLNRDEFLTHMADLGTRLMREFLVDERPVTVGAPEQAAFWGFLFDCRGRAPSATP